MKTQNASLFMGLLLLTGTVGMAQSKMNDRVPEMSGTSTTEQLLADQVQKVSDYLEALKTADAKSAKRIRHQMGKSQIEILRLNKQLHEEAMSAAAKTPVVQPVVRYDFDEFENSLAVHELLMEENADNDLWDLHFSSEETGAAVIEVLTPGGLVAFRDHVADFKGHYQAQFAPKYDGTNIWFVHITIGDKATTKKLVFD